MAQSVFAQMTLYFTLDVRQEPFCVLVWRCFKNGRWYGDPVTIPAPELPALLWGGELHGHRLAQQLNTL